MKKKKTHKKNKEEEEEEESVSQSVLRFARGAVQTLSVSQSFDSREVVQTRGKSQENSYEDVSEWSLVAPWAHLFFFFFS